MSNQEQTTSKSGGRPPRKTNKSFWTFKRALLLFLLIVAGAGAAAFFLPTERTVEAKGHVNTDNEAELRPSVQGVIRQWLVRSGDRVEKNQVVIQLDDRIQQARLEHARKQRKILEARLEHRTRAMKLTADERKAQIFRAEKVLTSAEEELQRITESGPAAFSPTEVAAAELRAQLARSELQELRISRDEVDRQEIQVLREQITAAHDAVALHEAEVERRKIRAPLDGTVQFNSYEPGEVVKPEHVLGQVFDRSKWVVKLMISERAMPHVEVGQSVDIALTGYPTLKHGTVPGRITRLIDIVTPQPTGDGVFYAEATLEPEHGRRLSPGMGAMATIHAGTTTLLGSWLGW
jgi:multidrug resistance efflux pump